MVREREEGEAAGRRFGLRQLPIALIAAVALAGAVLMPDLLSLGTLQASRAELLAFRDAHWLASRLLFVAAYVAVVALSLPGALVMTLAGGFLFGTLTGAALTLVGATAGAVILFLAARAGIGAPLAARLAARGGRLARLREGLEANAVPVLLLLRLLPVVPFWVANLLPALAGVRLGVFAWTTLVGIAPATVVYSSVGAGLGALLDRGEAPDLGVILSPPLLLPLLGLAALAALPLLIRRRPG